MCAKPEPTEIYQPLNDLFVEFRNYDPSHNLFLDTAWSGTTLYRGLLENV